jgi:hypothetical protein
MQGCCRLCSNRPLLTSREIAPQDPETTLPTYVRRHATDVRKRPSRRPSAPQPPSFRQLSRMCMPLDHQRIHGACWLSTGVAIHMDNHVSSQISRSAMALSGDRDRAFPVSPAGKKTRNRKHRRQRPFVAVHRGDAACSAVAPYLHRCKVLSSSSRSMDWAGNVEELCLRMKRIRTAFRHVSLPPVVECRHRKGPLRSPAIKITPPRAVRGILVPLSPEANFPRHDALVRHPSGSGCRGAPFSKSQRSSAAVSSTAKPRHPGWRWIAITAFASRRPKLQRQTIENVESPLISKSASPPGPRAWCIV